jgi:hypothetical protein
MTSCPETSFMEKDACFNLREQPLLLDARKNMTTDDVIEDDEEFIQLLFSMIERRSDGSPMSDKDGTSTCSRGSVEDCCSKDNKEPTTNIGSMDHAKDPVTCKSIPCSYYQKPGGCKLGHLCKFCHMCFPLTRKQIVEFNKKRRNVDK